MGQTSQIPSTSIQGHAEIAFQSRSKFSHRKLRLWAASAFVGAVCWFVAPPGQHRA